MSFYIILFEISIFFWLKNNIHQFSEHKFSWIQLTPIQRFPRLIPMPQAVDCDPQAVTVSQSSVVNSMQEEPSEIAVVQISRTEYIMKCYHDMVDQIPKKRILRPWN